MISEEASHIINGVEGSIDTSDLGTNVGDKTIVPSKYHKNENFKTDKEKDNVVKAFTETYGGKKTDYYVDWNRYKKNENYREEVNYYYLIALNLSQAIEEFKNFPERYTEVLQKEALFHNMIDGKIKVTGNLNRKFVNKENGREFFFTHDLKNVVKDANNVGTFNYYTYEKVYELDSLKHSIDIYNWLKYGTGINDKSTYLERYDYFELGTEISINYNSIKKWAEDRKITHIGRKELENYYRDKKGGK